MKHCWRRTRGAEQTTRHIEQLLLSLLSATDILPVPLLKEDIHTIWAEQKTHCLHSGSSRHHFLYCRWTPCEGRSEAAGPPLCQGIHIAGKLPPTSSQVHSRFLCQRSKLSGLSCGWNYSLEYLTCVSCHQWPTRDQQNI